MAHGGEELGFRLVRHFGFFPRALGGGESLIPGCFQSGQMARELIELLFDGGDLPGILVGIQGAFLIVAGGQLTNPSGQISDGRENSPQKMVDNQDGKQEQGHANGDRGPEDILSPVGENVMTNADLNSADPKGA